jgi:hypothetical protein
MGDSVARPALYYPYIHIRSEHWLKATLLCVPVVKRIVPKEYPPEDLPHIVKYTKITGPSGALLQAVPSFSPAALEAQALLLARLREHEAEIRQKYQRRHAPRRDSYRIHEAKLYDELLHYLIKKKLAWQSAYSHAYGHRTWYAMHPRLGSAVMTTLGLSIAREQRYDIVTPSTRFHEMLLTSRQDAVFDTLLSTQEPNPAPTPAQARHDLGQLAITLTGVNYQALRPEDIPELQSSEHFHKFQDLIRTTAQRIDREDDARPYEQQLRCEAKKIIDAWHEAKRGLSRELKNALFEDGLMLSSEVLKGLLTGPQKTNLVIAGGVAIALVTRRVLRFRKKMKQGDQYHYLTRIVRKQNDFLRISFPLGLEP